MACCGAREKPDKISETQKWDYINLTDFRSNSCIPPLSYFILFISFLISIAVYVIDIFTAGQLLIFDKWAGKIQPKVSFSISRWVFLSCIIASWIFLIYRFWKARRAIKSGGIAQSYLDPLAVRLQSARVGNGHGWRRFLVFAEMTKGKKGADYVALFTFFSFEAWYRIIFAEGPRNVINAMTLWAIFESDLLPGHQQTNLSPILQFLNNVKVLADGDHIRAAVLIGMLFVLITWVLAFLSLVFSCLFYVFYLWGHIPKSDRTLRGYCKRKVDSRLSKIVDIKVTKALEKADARAAKHFLAAGKAGESIADIKQQPTLPVLGDDMLPAMPSIHRQNAQSSVGSYGSNAPLISDAGPVGYASPASFSPAPSGRFTPGQQSLDRQNTNHSGRLMSPMPSEGRYTPGPPQRSNTGFSDISAGSRGPPRLNTPYSGYPQGRSSPAPGFPPGRNSPAPGYPQGRNSPAPGYPQGRNSPAPGYPQGRNSPAPSYRPNRPQEYEMRSQTPSGYPNRAQTSSPYGGPYQPPRSGPASYKSPTQRSFTSPTYGAQQHYGQPPNSGYNDSIYDHY